MLKINGCIKKYYSEMVTLIQKYITNVHFRCDERLLNMLKVKGEPTEFIISTVNEQSSLRRGVKVNLTLHPLTGKGTLYLQDVLSIDRLPVAPNPPLTKEELDAWPHLQGLDLPNIVGKVRLLIARPRRLGSKRSAESARSICTLYVVF